VSQPIYHAIFSFKKKKKRNHSRRTQKSEDKSVKCLGQEWWRHEKDTANSTTVRCYHEQLEIDSVREWRHHLEYRAITFLFFFARINGCVRRVVPIKPILPRPHPYIRSVRGTKLAIDNGCKAMIIEVVFPDRGLTQLPISVRVSRDLR
jgi:hypothetical protein